MPCRPRIYEHIEVHRTQCTLKVVTLVLEGALPEANVSLQADVALLEFVADDQYARPEPAGSRGLS
jgi:hypothetical protein